MRQDPADSTGILIRSRTEIARVLRELCRSGAPLTAYFDEGRRMFLSRLLRVAADEDFVIAEYGLSRPWNAALLGPGAVIFHCNAAQAHVEFPAQGLEEATYQGRPALRFAFPGALARFQRREHARVVVPPRVSLRCIADSGGVAPFEARVIDYSRRGLGAIVFDPRIKVETGTHLKRSKIVFPDASAVLVDLEVRYTQALVLEDGTPGLRAGCRVVGSARDLDKLAAAFVQVIAAGAAG